MRKITLVTLSTVLVGFLGALEASEVSEVSEVQNINTIKCIACHGKNFEKSALGKSRIVKDLNATEIETSLIGYKNNKGGPLKGVMKAQVSKYSTEEIVQLSKEIGKK